MTTIVRGRHAASAALLILLLALSLAACDSEGGQLVGVDSNSSADLQVRPASDAFVRIGPVALLADDGVVIHVAVSCPEGYQEEFGFSSVTVDQAETGTTGFAPIIAVCDGRRHQLRLLTDQDPAVDFQRGVANAFALLLVCSADDCLQVEDSRVVRIRGSTRRSSERRF